MAGLAYFIVELLDASDRFNTSKWDDTQTHVTLLSMDKMASPVAPIPVSTAMHSMPQTRRLPRTTTCDIKPTDSEPATLDSFFLSDYHHSQILCG